RFADFPLLPSYWLSQSVLQWSEGSLKAAGFFVLVLLSHVLFFGYLSFTRMGNWFYESFSTVQSRESAFSRWKWFQILRERKKIFTYPEGVADTFLLRRTGLTPDVRALVLKDARM